MVIHLISSPEMDFSRSKSEYKSPPVARSPNVNLSCQSLLPKLKERKGSMLLTLYCLYERHVGTQQYLAVAKVSCGDVVAFSG